MNLLYDVYNFREDQIIELLLSYLPFIQGSPQTGKNLYLDIQNVINLTLLTKTTAVQNEVALTYHKVRGLYFLAVVFAATIDFLVSLTSILDFMDCLAAILCLLSNVSTRFGGLYVGDAILVANQYDLRMMPHQQAVKCLSNCGDEVILKVYTIDSY